MRESAPSASGGNGWETLATVRTRIDRELSRHWVLSLSAGYSTSSVTSSTGIRRLSASLTAGYRF